MAERLQPGTRAGQSMVELAVFGSLLIMLLGVMVNYGLNYSYNQQMQMRAFREALATAATQGSGAVTLIDDRHVPNPASMFGIGAMTTVSASQNVVRTNELHKNPDRDEALPRQRIMIGGELVTCNPLASSPNNQGCTTAGFRPIYIDGTELKVDDKGKWSDDDKKVSSFDKYVEIYGGNSICMHKGCGSEAVGDAKKPTRFILRLLDPCYGEILSKEGCTRIALQIHNVKAPGYSGGYCERECEKGRSFNKEETKDLPSCKKICDQTIDTPWYARKNGNVFPELEVLFGSATGLGPQPGQVKTTGSVGILRKVETADDIRTTTTAALGETTERTVYFRDTMASASSSRVDKKVSTYEHTKAPGLDWTTPWKQ